MTASHPAWNHEPSIYSERAASHLGEAKKGVSSGRQDCIEQEGLDVRSSCDPRLQGDAYRIESKLMARATQHLLGNGAAAAAGRARVLPCCSFQSLSALRCTEVHRHHSQGEYARYCFVKM